MRYLAIVALAGSLTFSCVSAPRIVGDDGIRVIADVKPVRTARVGVSMDKFFSKDLAAADLNVVFHPRTNEVSLDFVYQGNRNSLFLTEPSRYRLMEAVRAYESDFEARRLNLSLKSSRSRTQYGEFSARLEWGLLTLNGLARPILELGYIFHNKRNPYFVIFVPQTINENGQSDDDKSNDNSIETVLFFTRAQARAMADALVQDTLLAALNPMDLRKEEAPDEYVVE